MERSLSAVTNGKIQTTLAALLAKRKENALCKWVFYNPCNPNLPMNSEAAYRKLHTVLKNAKLPLMRFYEVNGGQILFDGISTQDMSCHYLRGLMGMVLQDTWLFRGTVA